MSALGYPTMDYVALFLELCIGDTLRTLLRNRAGIFLRRLGQVSEPVGHVRLLSPSVGTHAKHRPSVSRPAANRLVAGSVPARGAKFLAVQAFSESETLPSPHWKSMGCFGEVSHFFAISTATVST